MTDGASARWRDSVSGGITGGHDTIKDPGSKDPGVKDPRVRDLSQLFLVNVAEEGEECCIVSVRGGTKLYEAQRSRVRFRVRLLSQPKIQFRKTAGA